MGGWICNFCKENNLNRLSIANYFPNQFKSILNKHQILITNGTPFSSAHAYKAEGEGSFLRYGTVKKPKGYKGHVPWPGAKKAPHMWF